MADLTLDDLFKEVSQTTNGATNYAPSTPEVPGNTQITNMQDLLGSLEQSTDEGSFETSGLQIEGGPILQDQSPAPTGDFTAGLESSVVGLKALGQAAVATGASLIGLDEVASDWAMDYLETSKEQQRLASGAKIQSIEDIEGFDDFLDWAQFTAGSQLPNLSLIMATGGVSGLLGKMVAKRVISEQIATIAAKKLATATARSAMLGTAAASGALGIGEVGGEQIDEFGKVTNPALATAAGVGIGALDMIGPAALIGKLGLTDSAMTRFFVKTLYGNASKSGLTRRVLRGGAANLATEGVTEWLQEEIGIAARATEDMYFDPTGDEANSRRLNALAAGALMGGITGGIGGTLKTGDVGEQTPISKEAAALAAKLDKVSRLDEDLDYSGVDAIAPEDKVSSDNSEELARRIQEIDDMLLQMGEEREGEIGKTEIPELMQETEADYSVGWAGPVIMELEDNTRIIDGDGSFADPNNPTNYHERKHKAGTVEVIGQQLSFEEASFMRNIQKQMEVWLQEFLPQHRIVLKLDPTPAGVNGQAMRNIKADLGMIRIPMSVYHRMNTNLNNLKGRQDMMETMAHEFGHIAIDTLYRESSLETQRGLMNAYRRYLKYFYDNKGSIKHDELVKTIYGPVKEWSKHENIMTIPKVSPYGIDRTYVFSFVEFLAQRTARYLTDTAALRDDDSLTTPFYKKALKWLRNFFTRNLEHFHPNQTFIDWMDQLRGKRSLERQAEAHYERNGRVMPFDETVTRKPGESLFRDPTSFGVTVPWVYDSGSIGSLREIKKGSDAQVNPYVFADPADERMQGDEHRVIYSYDATKLRGVFDKTGRGTVAASSVESSNRMDALSGLKISKAAMEEMSGRQLKTFEDLMKRLETKEGFSYRETDTHVILEKTDMLYPVQDTRVMMEANNQVRNILSNVGYFEAMQAEQFDTAGDAAAERERFLTASDLDFYGQGVRMLTTIVQLLKKNRHIEGVTRYMEAVYAWTTTRMKLITMADDRIKDWTALGKEQAWRLGRFMQDLNNEETWPATDRMLEIARLHGLTEESLAVYNNIKDDFRRMLDEMEKVAVINATRALTNPDLRANRLKEIKAQFKAMRDKPYFPLTRYGNHTVTVRALAPGEYQGKTFAAGDLVYMETFEDQLIGIGKTFRADKKQEARFQELVNGDFADRNVFSVSKTYLSEASSGFKGIPPAFLESLREQLKLTQEQREAMDQIIFMNNPANSFKHHFRKRKSVPGYDSDAVRAYADYFFHGANHIARLKHDWDLRQSIGMVRKSAERLGRIHGANNEKRVKIHDHLVKHHDYIMNPESEWASLRSVAFHWYLGFMVKSAVVNLTQVPIATNSYLAASYSQGAALKAIARGYKTLRERYKANWQSLPEHLHKVLAMAEAQGFLDESQATELAAVADGSNVQRAMAGNDFQRLIRGAGYYGSWLFHQAEKINRAVTFNAAYDLALENLDNNTGLEHLENIKRDFATTIAKMGDEMGLTENQAAAFISARDAVSVTQGEYARWNRPEIMRGKRGIIFVFKQFVQHMLWLSRYEPGGKQYLLVMLALAGVSGLPFAEDIMDIAGWAMRKFGYRKGPREYAREFAMALGANPDMIMHGVSRDSFGLRQVADMVGIPLPAIDLSGSMSMGRVIPGVEPLTSQQDFSERVSRAGTDTGGALVSAAMGIMQALADDHPDHFKRFEKALPSVLKSISKSYRYMRDGAEMTRTGRVVADFNPHDPMSKMEIIATALGFPSTRVTQSWEQIMAQRDAEKFFLIRRASLMEDVNYAKRTKDREAYADAKKAIKRYNKEAPRKLRIRSRDLHTSLRAKARIRRRQGQGLPIQRRYTELYRQIEELYPTIDDMKAAENEVEPETVR